MQMLFCKMLSSISCHGTSYLNYEPLHIWKKSEWKSWSSMQGFSCQKGTSVVQWLQLGEQAMPGTNPKQGHTLYMTWQQSMSTAGYQIIDYPHWFAGAVMRLVTSQEIAQLLYWWETAVGGSMCQLVSQTSTKGATHGGRLDQWSACESVGGFWLL